MSDRYDICFSGQILQGHDTATVRDRLAQLFKADTTTLDRLFSGKTVIIKRACDKATALQYKKAMEKAGAQPVFRASEPRVHQASAVIGPATTKISADNASSGTSNRESGGISLAAPQTDVLRVDERAVVAEPTFDTSMLQLDEPGTLLMTQPLSPALPSNTDHLSIAEAGATIPNLSPAHTPMAPSTPDVELAEVGADMNPLVSTAHEAPPVDLSALTVEPAGSDILKEHQRTTNSGSVPSTDHLSLDD